MAASISFRSAGPLCVDPALACCFRESHSKSAATHRRCLTPNSASELIQERQARPVQPLIGSRLAESIGQHPTILEGESGGWRVLVLPVCYVGLLDTKREIRPRPGSADHAASHRMKGAGLAQLFELVLSLAAPCATQILFDSTRRCDTFPPNSGSRDHRVQA